MDNALIIGMVGSASSDRVDTVLVDFERQSMNIVHARCVPYPVAIRSTLDRLIETGQPAAEHIASLLHEQLGRFFARTAQDLVRECGMEMRDIAAIGSHGQTVWHGPGDDRRASIRLGNPALIARSTATMAVANFEAADLRCGGQGAPLAPLLHRRLFYRDNENRAVLNLGGIANLTLLPASGTVTGFDCGPGNCLMDAWARRHLQQPFDQNGAWAAKGAVNGDLLRKMLGDPYFGLAPPRRTGVEYFNLGWVDQSLSGTNTDAVDIQATLAELTAVSMADSLHQQGAPNRLLVCGGGVHNQYLMRRIRAALPDVIVESTAFHGTDPDWVEGLLFAWLARERLEEKIQDTPPITGAREAVLLGDIFLP